VFLVVERFYLLSMRLGPNYAAVPGMVRGEQKAEVLSGSETILSATNASHVTDASKCNFKFNSRHKLYQPVIFGVYIRVSGKQYPRQEPQKYASETKLSTRWLLIKREAPL
jgi:hypothetical protein